ncbi:MAG: substrate-binding domain-containing protein [Breznakibacter sp.]
MTPVPATPRIKDIAKLAGVSIGTVDRVLHNRGEVAAPTREKILKIANDLSYSPNLMARALKSNAKSRIVVLFPESSEPDSFWYKHHVGLDRLMHELSSLPVVVHKVEFNMLSESNFSEKMDEVLSLSPDGVLIAPVFRHETRLFCQKLSEVSIPYVFIDSYISEENFLAFIGEDAYQSGRVAAQLIDYGTPSDKDILIVNLVRDFENALHLNSRMQGFLSYFMDAGKNNGLKISLEIQRHEDDEVAERLGQVLRNNPNIGAVFVTSSKAYKVARYFEEKGIRGINLIGYDLLDRNVKYLRTGYIRFLLSQRPVEQIKKGVEKLYEFLAFNRVPVSLEYLPIDVVTPENVNFFI